MLSLARRTVRTAGVRSMATQITMVKKIKADGSPCNKCDQVTAKLEKEGHMDKITK